MQQQKLLTSYSRSHLPLTPDEAVREVFFATTIITVGGEHPHHLTTPTAPLSF